MHPQRHGPTIRRTCSRKCTGSSTGEAEGCRLARLEDVRQRKHAGADIKVAERAGQAQAARPHAQRAPPARERAVRRAHACMPTPRLTSTCAATPVTSACVERTRGLSQTHTPAWLHAPGAPTDQHFRHLPSPGAVLQPAFVTGWLAGTNACMHRWMRGCVRALIGNAPWYHTSTTCATLSPQSLIAPPAAPPRTRGVDGRDLHAQRVQAEPMNPNHSPSRAAAHPRCRWARSARPARPGAGARPGAWPRGGPR